MKRLIAASLLLIAATGGGSQTPPSARKATCVFTNPAFAGKCVETPDVAAGSSPAAACEAILTCLNDVRCIKVYCQATTIRVNWKLESALPAAPRKP
ncbi:MAG: hypothetical protein WAU32_15020 [Thermoanaerobaculia bacterium]